MVLTVEEFERVVLGEDEFLTADVFRLFVETLSLVLLAEVFVLCTPFLELKELDLLAVRVYRSAPALRCPGWE